MHSRARLSTLLGTKDLNTTGALGEEDEVEGLPPPEAVEEAEAEAEDSDGSDGSGSGSEEDILLPVHVPPGRSCDDDDLLPSLIQRN